MRNFRSSLLHSLVATLVLISAPLRAEAIMQNDKKVTLNNPDIKKIGKGAARHNWVGIKLPEADFILRSSPVEADAVLYLFRNNDNYDILSCRTPCLFKIPNQSSFRFNVIPPTGYSLISKPVPIRWGMRDLQDVIKPDEITFEFIKN